MSKHEDERGVIEDLKVGKDWSITYITFKKGAVRGNHLHKMTTQKDTILSGKFQVRHGNATKFLEAGDELTLSPGIAHAYKALEDGEMVSVCFGVRIGEDYSKDTYKLATPLI
jgi:quercetin dioxygenase-like cupin family protein